MNSIAFKERFEEGFRRLLVPVLKENGDREATLDTFFLLSVEEMKDEEKKYQRFRSERDCVKVNPEQETEWHWTRSASRGSASQCVVCERVRRRRLQRRSVQQSLRPGLRHRSESNQIISARHAGRRRAKGEKNMGLMDAITAEDRVQLKVSDLETLMKNAAKADLIFNGIRAEVPHRYMREIITGKKEEDADETKASKETEGQEHETTD